MKPKKKEENVKENVSAGRTRRLQLDANDRLLFPNRRNGALAHRNAKHFSTAFKVC